ncbi:MAG: hypothetical protein Q8N23_20465 [Archangium sp.]|nr:hypothetical protein [Archangium sp.]MDP3155065.1 hypothetical protein [Archangium sp.]MDP3572083.1 hypothetical protein [Archangium sp.]
MSILSRLIHDMVASHEGVVNDARAQLDKELRPVATAPFAWRLVPVGQLMSSGEAMTESLRTLIGSGKLRVDRVLYTAVPTASGTLEIAVPFSGKDTLAPQFSLRLNVRAPAGALLARGAMGSWGLGNWVPSLGSDPTAGQQLCAQLESANVSSGIEWNCELPGNYLWKLGWTLQLVPSGPGQSRLLMQSGRVGILFTRFGVDVFLKKVDAAFVVLANLAAFPEAPEGVVEQCWADRVSPLLAAQPNLGMGSAPGVIAAVPPSPQERFRTRGTTALVLSIIALPTCCLPLGLVGGGLALHTRAEAKKANVEPPGTTLAALVLSIASLVLLGILGAIALFAPPPPQEEAVVKKSKAPKPDDDGPLVQAQLGGDPSKTPRTGFLITNVFKNQQASDTAPFHTAGGDWTYFEAALEEDESCVFTVGVSPTKDAGGFGFGKMALSVPDGASADCLVSTLSSDFSVETPTLRRGAVKAPLTINTAVLGQGLARSRQGGFSGKGSWVATKLFFEGPNDSAEVFFNYDFKSKVGEFSEKDAEYDQPMVDLLNAALREDTSKPRTKRQKK